MDIKKLQRVVVDALEDVKAQNIKVYNTIGLSDMFDRVVLATGTSNRQTRALAYHVAQKVKEAGGHVVSIEGADAGEWVLVDLGDLVVHVMQPAVREYYALEEIWGGKPVRVKTAESGARRIVAHAAAAETGGTSTSAGNEPLSAGSDGAQAAPKRANRTPPSHGAPAAELARTGVAAAPKKAPARKRVATTARTAAAKKGAASKDGKRSAKRAVAKPTTQRPARKTAAKTAAARKFDGSSGGSAPRKSAAKKRAAKKAASPRKAGTASGKRAGRT